MRTSKWFPIYPHSIFPNLLYQLGDSHLREVLVGQYEDFFSSDDKFIRHVFSSPCERYYKLFAILPFFSKRLSNCISRLNDIIEKLEQTDERLSVVVDGHDGAQEVEQLITEDWSYIAEVVDSRYELEDIQQTLQVQRSSQENISSRYVKENKFNQVLQLTAQMKNILICQQQLEQQQLKLVELSNEGCYRGPDRGHLENCYMPQDSVGAEDCENF